MVHVVCGQPVQMRRQVLDDQLTLMVPACDRCGGDVPDTELA